jgi:polar amino acid transport system substrate-binding protein
MRKASRWLSALAVVAVAGCTSTDTTTTRAAETAAVTPPAYKLVTPGKLMIGSDLDFPPMEMLNGTTPEGFDVDLMTALAKEMGLTVEYLPPQKFDTLLAAVNGGKFDVVASSLTINDERKKIVVFSDPYFDSNQSIAMKEGSTYNTPADMKGKKIGAQSGTTGFDWATSSLPAPRSSRSARRVSLSPRCRPAPWMRSSTTCRSRRTSSRTRPRSSSS